MFTKKPIPLLLFLLFLWIGGLSWVGQRNYCCGPEIPSLLIKDGTTTIGSSENNFHFGFGLAPAKEIGTVQSEMQKIADYLNLEAHSNKLLTVTGRYRIDEENTTTFDNLGWARAEDIKNYLVGLGAPAERIFTGSELVEDLNFKDEKTYDGINWTWENLTRNISFIDGDAHNNIDDDDFVFAKSGFEHKAPIDTGLGTTIGKTAEYLKKSGRNMRITGYYMEDEKNSGALNDLGLARANNIKKVFTDLGVSSKQLEIASAVKALRFIGNEASAAASYEFFGAKNESRLPEVEARLRAQPLILYFDTNKFDLNLNNTQRQYLTDLIYYLDNKDGASVNSTGHTDNKGKLANNVRLGRKRAEFIRDYLKRNNISETKVRVVSKGPDAPTATNDTPEGRAQNRRVEISIN